MADNDVTADLPKYVFGLTLDQHRKAKMQNILEFLQEKGYSKYNKGQLMLRLSEVERHVSCAQERSIKSWLGEESEDSIADIFYRQNTESSQLQSSLVINSESANEIARQDFGPATIIGEEPPELQPKLRECSICVEEFTFADFPNQISAGCMHDPTCCHTCLSRSIGVQIESKPWDQIACPECPVILSFDDVKSFASKTDFIRYDTNSLLSYIQNDPNFTNCLGPNCNGGQIHEDGDTQPIITCGTCSFKTCFTHNIPWHTGLTCQQYDDHQKKRVEQEEASLSYLAKKSTDCPSCGAHVSKTSGCDHIKCKCGTEFCYACGVDYKILNGYNDKHRPTCPHFSGNLPRHPQQ